MFWRIHRKIHGFKARQCVNFKFVLINTLDVFILLSTFTSISWLRLFSSRMKLLQLSCVNSPLFRILSDSTSIELNNRKKWIFRYSPNTLKFHKSRNKSIKGISLLMKFTSIQIFKLWGTNMMEWKLVELTLNLFKLSRPNLFFRFDHSFNLCSAIKYNSSRRLQ